MWKQSFKIMTFLLLASVISIDAKAADTLSNGLVGYWKFDTLNTNNTVEDFSPLKNNPGIGGPNIRIGNAVIIEGNVGISSNKFDKALAFDASMQLLTSTTSPVLAQVGGQYVMTNKFASPTWSISMWINPVMPIPNPQPFGAAGILFSGDRDSANKAQYIAIRNDGVYMLYTQRIVAYDFRTNPGWHHIVVTFDGKFLTATVDGLTSGSIPYTNNLMGLSANRYIGANSATANSQVFFGLIDEVRLYSRVLNKIEIARLYNPSIEIPASNPQVTKVYPDPSLMPFPDWTRYAHIVVHADRPVYCRAANVSGKSFADMSLKFNSVAQNKVYLNIPNLSPGYNMTYYVRCEDLFGMQNESEIVFNLSVRSDTTPPVIEDLTSSAVRETTAEIVWMTKEPSDSYVEYWEQGSSTIKTSSNLAYGIPHAQLLLNLKPNTTYLYKVSSTDRAGNKSAVGQGSFITKGKAPQFTFYVATNGNDANPGTIDKPFLTFEGARNAIRTLKTSGKLTANAGGVQVYIRQGTYFRTTQFVLNNLDSGTATDPIRYSAYNNESVIVSGGVELKGFVPVPASSSVYSRFSSLIRDKIVQVPLSIDPGVLTVSGSYVIVASRQPAMNLFFQDKPMIMARWPNLDPNNMYARFTKIKSVPAGVPDTFITEDTRPSRWKQPLSAADDIWVHGAWRFDHRDTHLKLTSAVADPNGGFKLTAPKIINGVANSETFQEKRPFYYENILEELDSPGEWYLDRSTKMLYFYPPADLSTSKVVASVAPMLVSFESTASHITLSGITFENVRGTAVKINQSNSFILIENSTIRNAYIGAYVSGKHSGIWGSKIYNIDDNGVILFGGVDTKLENGYNFIVNNEIYAYGLRDYSYRAGVNMSGTDIIIFTAGPSTGVGNRVRYNKIYDGKHMGIVFRGNNYIIDYNEIYDTAKQTVDVGAIYGYAPGTFRGSLVRHNYIHDIKGFDFTNNTKRLHAVAIYYDNDQSQVTTYGNVINRLKGDPKDLYPVEGVGYLINGGRDNIFENNIIVNSDFPLHLGTPSYNILAKNFRIPIENVGVGTVSVNGSYPLIVKTVRPHGNDANMFEYKASDRVIVSDVQGEPGANSDAVGWLFQTIDQYKILLNGTTSQGKYSEGGYILQATEVYNRLRKCNYKLPPYSEYYPTITKYTFDPADLAIDVIDDAEPKGNTVTTNIFYNTDTTVDKMYPSPEGPLFYSPTNNYTADPQFENFLSDDFRLKATSPVFATGFKPIPFNEIGLIKSTEIPPSNNLATGDVTDNGRVTLYDAVMIKRYMLNPTVLLDSQVKMADVNNNKDVDADDAQQVGEYATGIITSYTTR